MSGTGNSRQIMTIGGSKRRINSDYEHELSDLPSAIPSPQVSMAPVVHVDRWKETFYDESLQGVEKYGRSDTSVHAYGNAV